MECEIGGLGGPKLGEKEKGETFLPLRNVFSFIFPANLN
jgi:hypothetical protein